MTKRFTAVLGYSALALVACNLSGERTYGGARNQNAVEIKSTSDGGAVIAGHTVSGSNSGSDLYVLKLDDEGDVQWSYEDGGSGFERGAGVIPIGGGYLVAGTTESEGAGDPTNFGSYINVTLTRLDASGKRQWKRVYGETMPDGVSAMARGSAGQIALAGYTHNAATAPAALLVRYDEDGTFLGATKVEDPVLKTVARAISATPDGGFLLAGSGFAGGDKSDGVLVKIDASGVVSWVKKYGTAELGEVFEDVRATPDGGFIAAGYTSNWWPEKHSTDAWLVKVDANGQVQWEGTYGGANNDEATAVTPVAGGYVFTGATNSFGDSTAASDDIWVVGIDESGVQRWSRTYGGDGNNYGTDIRATAGGGLLVAGDTFPDFALINAYDIYVARLSADGELE